MFELSASRLGTALNCRRQYYYQYVNRLDWPESFDDDFQLVEEFTRLGRDFHLAIQRVLQGILTIDEAIRLNTGDVGVWLTRWKRMVVLPKNGEIFSELALSSLHGDFLWRGTLDLLVRDGDRIHIYDWKTSRHQTNRAKLESMPQTRLYRALFVENAAALFGMDRSCVDQIKMTYWYTNFPEQPITISYSERAYQADVAWISEIAETLRSEAKEDYPLTLQLQKCKYCRYRTHCNRAIPDLAESDADEFDWGWMEADFDPMAEM